MSDVYTPTTVLLKPNQEKKIKRAVHQRRGCVIHVTKGGGDSSPMAAQQDLNARHSSKAIIHLTTPQCVKLHDAAVGETVPLHMRHEHLVENLKHKGGIIPILIGLLASAAGAAAGEAIGREISGGGVSDAYLCMRNNKHSMLRVSPHADGLFLRPWRGKTPSGGRGLYLRPRPRGGTLQKVDLSLLPKSFTRKHRTTLKYLTDD